MTEPNYNHQFTEEEVKEIQRLFVKRLFFYFAIKAAIFFGLRYIAKKALEGNS